MYDQTKAKALFLKYLGSHSHMERDGEYEVYKSFNISIKREQEWLENFQIEILGKLLQENDELSFENTISDFALTFSNCRNAPALTELLNILKLKIDSFDSFTILLVCENVIDIVDEFQQVDEDNDICTEAMHFVEATLNKLLSSPIKVSERYQAFTYLRGILTDDKIIARVNCALGRCVQGGH
jgi:hypothetical protein